ncbi:MAG: hypothetical protein GX806_07040, partial [Lentisphaerae bacterium]|nr:hypothetical protein [Lentisphaerota bacterium]
MKKHLFTAIALSATLMAGQMSQAAWPQLTHLAGELADPLREQAAWEAHDLVLYRSMLSPGALFRMQTPSIRFFGELEAYGAEGPTFFIVKTDKGVEALSLDTPLDGQRMKASWIVASFQDAKGWENFDAPWFIALEKRPQSITLTRAGLEIKFAEPDTGHIFSMPLYGWRNLPQAKKDFCAENKLPGSGLQPWKWKKRVPREVSERCDLRARIARAFPEGFQESF